MLTPFRMDLLAMGAILSIVWRNRKQYILRWGVWGSAAAALSIVALALLHLKLHLSIASNTRLGNVLIYELTLIGSTGVMVWALSGRGISFLRWPAVVFIGRISYSIYLIHETILYGLTKAIASRSLVGLLAAAGCIAYATISWRYFEQPILYHQQTRHALPDPRPVVGS